MEEDEVSMESDGRGSDGAGGSGDRLAARVAEIDIDVDAVTEQVTSEQSAARKTPFKGGETGVKKKDKGKKKSGFARNKAGPGRR